MISLAGNGDHVHSLAEEATGLEQITFRVESLVSRPI